MQYLQRYPTTCQALLYTKPNLTVVTITTPNGFRIRQYITEIRGVSKLPLAMNNPVGGPIFKPFGAVIDIRCWFGV